MYNIYYQNLNCVRYGMGYSYPSTRIGRKFENRYAAVYFKYFGDKDVEDLKADKNDEKNNSNRLHWIASKRTIFSSVLI